MDPYEVFKKNFVKAGDSYIWRDYKWWEVRSVDFTAAFEESAGQLWLEGQMEGLGGPNLGQ